MESVRQFLCNKSSYSFSHICGEFVPIGNRKNIDEEIKYLYSKYFGIDISNQEKCWVPHRICSSCRINLIRWSKREGHMKFGSTMIWRDPINHETNCYVCLTDIKGFSGRNRHSVVYANVTSVTHPVPHSQQLPIPNSPTQTEQAAQEFADDNDSDEELPGANDPIYIPDTTEPHPLTQMDLFDLVRDLNLTKEMSELLGSRLQQWCLLERGICL